MDMVTIRATIAVNIISTGRVLIPLLAAKDLFMLTSKSRFDIKAQIIMTATKTMARAPISLGLILRRSPIR